MTSVPKRVYANRRNVNIGGGVVKSGLPGSVGISTLLRRKLASRAPNGVNQSTPTREPRIVGELFDELEDESFAVYWNDAYSTPSLLKINESDVNSTANDINDNNIVVGSVRTENNNNIAVYWNNVNNIYTPLDDGVYILSR